MLTLSNWKSLKFVVWERVKSHLVTALFKSVQICQKGKGEAGIFLYS